MNLKPYIAAPEDAKRIAVWLRTRGGIAIWESLDMSRPGETLATAATMPTGDPTPQPIWWVSNKPACIITDPADVMVSITKPESQVPLLDYLASLVA